jgi:aspartate/methionine/tyrosine aminotransferase
MELKPFKLDQWLSGHAEDNIAFNMGGSTGARWTLGELLALDGDASTRRLLDTEVAYGLSAGGRDLRRAIADMSGRPVDQVLVMAGGSEALLHLFFLAAERGANVIVPFPGFPPYHAIPESLGLEVRTYHLRRENEYRIDLEEVQRLADANTRLILVNSPHNPTGAALADHEMRELHDFAADRHIQFACDEVFHPIYHGEERASASRLPHATIVGDCSKALALSGLRIGWLIEPDERRRERYLNAREYFSISNTPVGEFFAEIAVRHRASVLARTREVAGVNLRRLDRFMAEHADLLDWVRPHGGMTGFPRLLGAADARVFCETAVTEGILLTPGDCFGVPDHFRIGFGVGAQWFPEALDRLSTCLRSCYSTI